MSTYTASRVAQARFRVGIGWDHVERDAERTRENRAFLSHRIKRHPVALKKLVLASFDRAAIPFADGAQHADAGCRAADKLLSAFERGANAKHFREARAMAAVAKHDDQRAAADARAHELGERLFDQSTDKAVRLWAAARCAEARELAARLPSAGLCAWLVLADHCRRWMMPPPQPVKPRTLAACVERMRCDRWWRAVARREWAQHREYDNIQAGKVHAYAGLYVSDEMMQHVRARRRDNREMLEAMQAISDAGDVLDLVEAIDASVSNPELRCTEMMVRNAGMEFVSECRGDVALFVTWTLASRYHCRNWKGKKVWPNAKFDGASPRLGQQRLAELWDGFVRAARRKNIVWYGSRFVQPHHDGTPHWHVLIYVDPARREELECLLREWALTDDPDEKGALQRRCDIEEIDRSKGSAVGYVARYIARAIDGRSLKNIKERDDGGRQRTVAKADAVERVTAWSNIWRIRLFQFVGTPPVTVWRELRRVKANDDGMPDDFALAKLREAADAGDYAEWLELMGGLCVKRKLQTARTLRAPGDRLNRYGEPPANKVIGVQLSLDFATAVDPAVIAAEQAAKPLQRRRALRHLPAKREALERLDIARGQVIAPSVRTRRRRWLIVRKGDALRGVVASPWTRVNNCSGSDGGSAESPADFGLARVALRSTSPPRAAYGGSA